MKHNKFIAVKMIGTASGVVSVPFELAEEVEGKVGGVKLEE